MFKKTITTDFFTTIDGSMCINTLDALTYRLPFLRKGGSIEQLERELLEYLGIPDSELISFYRGSEALYHALEIIGLQKDDEVILQGYTCVVVSNAVKQSGAKLVYSDIEQETLGFDIKKLEKNITKKTKVILVQHTFGKPTDIDAVMQLAKKHHLVVIEDCAHSLGSKLGENHTGTLADFSMFSSGRDKVISSVTGGFLAINNSDYYEKASRMKNMLHMPSRTLTVRNLAYNILGYLAYKSYDFFKLGRIIMMLSRKCKLITDILSRDEKNCERTKFGTAFPNALAYLGRKELKKIDLYTTHRNNLSELYDMHIKTKYGTKIFTENKNESLNGFRYPFLLNSHKIQKQFVKYMKKHNILVGTAWSGINIAPKGINLKSAMYKKGSCPISEDISKRVVLLPNHMGTSTDDVMKVCELINKFESKHV